MATRACLYHCPCTDGAYAALCFKLTFRDDILLAPHSTTAEFQLEQFLQLHPTIRTLYLVDYCGPEGFLEQCSAQAQLDSVVLIDHHKTALDLVARANLSLKVDIILDMTKSGCVLAHEYCRKIRNVYIEAHVVLCLSFAQDYDLWTFKIPRSKEFAAGIRSLGLDFSKEDVILSLANYDIEQIISLGIPHLAKEEAQIAQALESSFPVKLGDVIYWAASPPDGRSDVISDLGNRLCAKTGYGVVYRIFPDGVRLSLRSSSKDKDTTVFSQKKGGGGHASSSGCTVKLEEWESWKVKDF